MHGARAPLAVLAFAALLALPAPVRAEPPESEFSKAVAALEQGAYGEAVDRLELLADRGFVHPDASFNRAVAYLGRARSPQGKEGDLGRAVHALSETLLLRPDDRRAEAALAAVRREIARRHARTRGAALAARPRLGRAIATLLPEVVWGVAALAGALALALGIALRFIVKRPSYEVAAALAMGVGALVMIVGGLLSRAAFYFETRTTPAVVVAPTARLLDAIGRPLPLRQGAEGSAIPEGSDVYVLERQGGLVRVEWGNEEAWVVASQVRELSRPPR
jgi:hypothetical protein